MCFNAGWAIIELALIFIRLRTLANLFITVFFSVIFNYSVNAGFRLKIGLFGFHVAKSSIIN